MDQILFCFFIFLYFFTFKITAQQSYSGNSVLDCTSTDETGPSPDFLYTCNSKTKSCRAFLIFKSQPPYNSVLTISKLLSSDSLELARINNVSTFADFPTDKEVIVPVNCFCSGQYYQANSSFVIPTIGDTYFTIANDTYQGLSSCNSLMDENIYSATSLLPGFELRVPLRCACPTSNQIANGTKFLLTYSVSWRDRVPNISERFNTSLESTLDANGLSEEDPTLFPFTTILIPLPTEPSSLQTIIQTPILSPPYSFNRKNRRKSNRGLYIGIGVAAASSVLVLLCIALTVVFLHHKKKQAREIEKKKKKWVLPEDLLSGMADMDQVLRVFVLDELKVATNNFSPMSRMKGSVFRGVLGGKEVAIKKMSTDVSKEVNILNKINHFNLIRLHGLCEDEGYFYLVYEFMENGCLKDWLRSKSFPVTQSWSQRVQIALDIAKGLHYLHNFTDPACVHKDINSRNVLLNGNLRAKIANFGLARSAERGEGRFPSTKLVGTRGYMAPEYLDFGWVTPKMDVYAFGVVMLELITGKDVILMHDGGAQFLSAAIMSIMEGEDMETKLGEFIDPNLRGNNGMELALAVTRLSVSCLTRDPMSRPSMDEVVSALVRIQMDSLKFVCV
ncbi:Protein kinase domain [Macleaya cordata]|uniref:Protein kinase domain n=1 Tax=Macleaya cordata TaxID=56857 RepID=A0A200R7I5_MACCD|nr:Protein kinase domain [Macleaya cordata]